MPGPISVERDPPTLSYREWDIGSGQVPGTWGSPFFIVHLAVWDHGSLRLECKHCPRSLDCPHAVAALDHVLALLHDPADPLSDALAPLLCVPSWSRFLDRLDSRLAKLVPAEEPTRRELPDDAAPGLPGQEPGSGGGRTRSR